jgi:hypothetical protein
VGDLDSRSMGQAVIGLIGVIIGGLLSGTATFLLARQQEALQAQVAARILEAELRSTARSVLSRGSPQDLAWGLSIRRA